MPEMIPMYVIRDRALARSAEWLSSRGRRADHEESGRARCIPRSYETRQVPARSVGWALDPRVVTIERATPSSMT